MLISVRWLNKYFSTPLSSEQIQHALIEAGFPIESATPLPNGDVRLDVELTSNRGDCLSHVGLAREVAAKLHGKVKLVAPTTNKAATDETSVKRLLSVDNTVPDVCPRFTARVIRGVKVGPSPAWLREALESVGQRSINNVVDITNFINFELGHPCHAFDLAKLGGGKLVIRYAREGEALTTLDGKARKLKSDELVVADAQRAQGLAGVIGGGDSEVSASTTDVVLEVATWDPVVVRRASRRHQVRTDASHRYERYVDARCVDAAAERTAALIAEASGGKVCTGAIETGRDPGVARTIGLRPTRCRELLGVDISDEEMVGLLLALEVNVGHDGGGLKCTPPHFRPDLQREIDLVEEIGRLHGLDKIPIQARMSIVVPPPQTSERSRREIESLLVGMGFFEATTFSFTSTREAELFMPTGMSAIAVDDERRKSEPVARPSVLTGLLGCRRKNQHAQAVGEEGARLFESASVFAQVAKAGEALPRTIEQTNLGLLIDVQVSGKTPKVGDLQTGVRVMRGVVESIVGAMGGGGVALRFEKATPHAKAFDPRAYASISADGAPLGYLGLLSDEAIRLYDLARPVVGAELNVRALTALYPPRASVLALPAFPGIERDVSLVVSEEVTWERVDREISRAASARAGGRPESWRFVTTFRGQQIGKGKKSMTVRLSYRDPERTLRHEEIDEPVKTLVNDLLGTLGATLRA